MAVAGSGVIPRKATLEARYSPRIAAAVANPLAGRGTQYRSRRTTPRSSHRTPAPGPIASGDAPNRTRAGCCFVVERASCGAPTDRSPDTQVRLATPAGAAIATGDAVVRAGGSARLHPWQSNGRHDEAAAIEAIVPGHGRVAVIRPWVSVHSDHADGQGGTIARPGGRADAAEKSNSATDAAGLERLGSCIVGLKQPSGSHDETTETMAKRSTGSILADASYLTRGPARPVLAGASKHSRPAARLRPRPCMRAASGSRRLLLGEEAGVWPRWCSSSGGQPGERPRGLGQRQAKPARVACLRRRPGAMCGRLTCSGFGVQLPSAPLCRVASRIVSLMCCTAGHRFRPCAHRPRLASSPRQSCRRADDGCVSLGS